jgi:hypothetical protein
MSIMLVEMLTDSTHFPALGRGSPVVQVLFDGKAALSTPESHLHTARLVAPRAHLRDRLK